MEKTTKGTVAKEPQAGTEEGRVKPTAGNRDRAMSDPPAAAHRPLLGELLGLEGGWGGGVGNG